MTILITMLLSSWVHAASEYAIAYQKGDVSITRGTSMVSDKVLQGDVVTTGKDGLVILKAPGESIKVMANSKISPRMVKNTTVVHLRQGSVVSQVKSKLFRIRTPMASFGVRGTSFFVHTQGKESWMCVQEGQVEAAATNKERKLVPAGKGVFVKDKLVSTPRPFAWTKEINWNHDPEQGQLDFKPKLNGTYDLKAEFYD